LFHLRLYKENVNPFQFKGKLVPRLGFEPGLQAGEDCIGGTPLRSMHYLLIIWMKLE